VRIRSRICAWIVTSSAVVGSSAISSFRRADERHRDHRALAHAARQVDADRRRCATPATESGPPQHLDRLLARRLARPSRDGAAGPSTIWSPIVNAGLSEVIGSWKIIAISLPRRSRIAQGEAAAGCGRRTATSPLGDSAWRLRKSS
jgi:hypothetical protein